MRNLVLFATVWLMLARGMEGQGFQNHQLHSSVVRSTEEIQRLAQLGYSSARHLLANDGKTLSMTERQWTNSPVSGNILPLGIYWAAVYVGTPQQGPFQVAIDTGSTDLMLPGYGCSGCSPSVTGVYAASKSSTAHELTCNTKLVSCHNCSVFAPQNSPCQFRNSYETCDLAAPEKACTIQGPLVQDMAGFVPQQSSVTLMVLGTIMNQSSDFQQLQYIDGIVGFSFPGSSAFRYHSLFFALYNAGVYSDNMFAMCLTPNLGGVLTIGGYDPSFISNGSNDDNNDDDDGNGNDQVNIPWTPIVSTEAFVLRLEGIAVGSRSLPGLSVVEVIIDSGTNLLLLDNARYSAIESQIKSQMCSSGTLSSLVPGVCNGNLFSGSCYNYTSSQIQQFPSITLELFSGYELPVVPLTINAEEYLISPNDGSASSVDTRCFGLSNTGESFNIIGDIVMQNYYTIFDVTNYRIGWPPVSNCLTKND